MLNYQRVISHNITSSFLTSSWKHVWKTTVYVWFTKFTTPLGGAPELPSGAATLSRSVFDLRGLCFARPNRPNRGTPVWLGLQHYMRWPSCVEDRRGLQYTSAEMFGAWATLKNDGWLQISDHHPRLWGMKLGYPNSSAIIFPTYPMKICQKSGLSHGIPGPPLQCQHHYQVRNTHKWSHCWDDSPFSSSMIGSTGWYIITLSLSIYTYIFVLVGVMHLYLWLYIHCFHTYIMLL